VPPRSSVPGSARDWLARAQGKLAMARQPLPPEGFLEDACFFLQQAAELAIKAVYQQHGWTFPYVHDLRGRNALSRLGSACYRSGISGSATNRGGCPCLG
jgi:HEPN domain-containing protein